MLNSKQSSLERAFELAQTGQYESATEIKRILMKEGHSTAQLTGPSLEKQLRGIMREARSSIGL